MVPKFSQASNAAYDFGGPLPTNACLRHAARRCGGKRCDGWRSVKMLCWSVWCWKVGSLFAFSSSLQSWLAKSQNIPHWQHGERGSSYREGGAAVMQ